MGLVPTPFATKPRLRGAIGSLDMFTLRTHLTGIGWIDPLEHHPGLLSLVGDELPKLIKSPATHAGALRLAKPGSLSEALEVFKGDSAPSAFGLLNESLGKLVVHISTKTRFTIRKTLELLANALTSSSMDGLIRRRLEFLFVSLASDPNPLYCFTRVHLTVRSPWQGSPRRDRRRGSPPGLQAAHRRIRPWP